MSQIPEAKYRISLLLDDALRSLKSFKTALADLKAPAAGTGNLNKEVDQAEARAKKAATAQKTAAKETTQVQSAELKAQAAAADLAAQEAIKAKRRQLAEDARVAKEAAAAQKAADRQARDEKRAADKKASFEAYQQRALAPQLTDITVGLATGQSPLTVLLQQGGQLKDVYGGVGNAFKALMSIFTVGRVVIAGVGAALAAVAFSAYQGHQESDALNKSLALTGNIAGVTAGSLDQSAKAIAANQKVSIGSAREALASAVETGAFIGSTLDSAGRAAVALSKLTGKSAADQIADFTALGSGVAEWAAKQNRAYNFLTADEYRHIRSLEAAGREQEAMRLVLDKLSGTMEQRAVPALGLLERAWNAVKKAVSDAGDTFKAIGRDTTPEDRIASAQALLAELQKGPQDQASRVRQGVLSGQIEAINLARNKALLRKSETSIELQGENDQIKREQKSYQDALIAIAEEGSRRLLVEQIAALEQRRAAVENANARGLMSAKDYALKVNAIEQQTAQAQLDEVNRRTAKARTAAQGTPTEILAQQARVKGLETQAAELEGKLRALSAQGRTIVDESNLEEARSNAEKWAEAWRQAYDQVRAFASQNAETAAGRLTDPIARADAEAKARVASIRQEFNRLKGELELTLSLTINPAQRDALQAQINELQAQGGQAIGEQERLAKLDSFRTQFGQRTDELRIKEAQLDEQVRQGGLTAEQAEQRKFELRDQALVQLDAILEAMQRLAATEGDRIAIDQLKESITGLKGRTTDLQATVRDTAKGAFSTLFSDIATGSKTALQAVKDFVSNTARSMLDLIGRKLGEKLFESLLGKESAGGKALEAGTSAASSWIATLFQHHDGGVIGSSGTPRAVGMGSVLAAMSGGLPYYHSGGISGAAGLRSNEELAVLQHGEEVLTADNPRHIKNFQSSIGNLSISTKVEGAQGSTADMTGAGDRLNAIVLGAINRWAVDESREGGVLAGGRR